MKTCTIEQAKSNAALIRKSIEQAETLRDEKRTVYARIRQDRNASDYGSNAWIDRNDRLHAMLDELSNSMGKILITANSMLADMSDTLITDESSTEMLADVTEKPTLEHFKTSKGLSIVALGSLAASAGIDTKNETKLIEWLLSGGVDKEEIPEILEAFGHENTKTI